MLEDSSKVSVVEPLISNHIESAKDFAIHHISPFVKQWDEEQFFPIDTMRLAGKYGLMGVLVPNKWGGAELDYHAYASIIEEISIVDPALGLSIAAHNSLCTNHIYLFGNDQQHRRWLKKLAQGTWLGAWGLTELDAGSDARGMKTQAIKQNNQWILNGQKNFITHGASSDVAVVLANAFVEGENKGITAFVVERGTKGFLTGKKDDKLGMRASETAEMIFDNCCIDQGNLLGNIGEGYNQSMKILEGGRVSIAALSLGIAKGAYRAALDHAKKREQFGRRIIDFQAIAFKIAQMATDIEASRLLIKNAAQAVNINENPAIPVCMAKLFASETCVKVSSEAVQIMAGYGYLKDYPVEKYYRDSKLCTIGEGTSEIQKLILSRKLTREK
ncbi:MAG: acyl-CoA dehydrogenase family protein [Flavobacteriaceae bacterium]|nr:acyl-CoA dehydrogenase family protein [Flavobacteriaceae bacterium]